MKKLFLCTLTFLLMQGPFAKASVAVCETSSDIPQGFLDFVEQPTLKALHEALSGYLPGTWYDGRNKEGGRSTLQFEFSNDAKSPWIHITIYDPTTLVRNLIFGGGYYKTETKFNVIDRGHATLEFVRLEETTLSILMKRDAEGVFYDRGTVFQELTITFEAGRPAHVIVRNGNHLWARGRWKETDIVIPAQVITTKGAFMVRSNNPADGFDDTGSKSWP